MQVTSLTIEVTQIKKFINNQIVSKYYEIEMSNIGIKVSLKFNI